MTTEIEAAFAKTLAEHLALNAEALRMVEVSRRMRASVFRDEPSRLAVIVSMRHQLVAEAFDVGLGILSCTDVFYRVHDSLAVRYEDEKAPTVDQPWRAIAPVPSELAETSVVELRLDAIGAPVLLREA